MTAKLTLAEILAFAKRIAQECANGLRRAFHYLRAYKIPAEIQCWALQAY